MDVQGITGATVPGASGAPCDIEDISFTVALLQIDTLDGEIGARLSQVEQLNELRKAYNERIGELQTALGGLKDGSGWVDADKLDRADYGWDASANGGSGGVAETMSGSLGAGETCRVVDASGNPVAMWSIDHFRPVDSSSTDGSGDGGLSRLPETPTRSTLDEARAVAADCGGTAQVHVTADQLKAEIDRLQKEVDNLGADGEVGMLSLNRLLSRRSQVLQLTSNIMSSVNQTAMGLIANLKV